ncbi:GntR family transcriptional regulator [Phycisphaeraceae bacterium D3-23]
MDTSPSSVVPIPSAVGLRRTVTQHLMRSIFTGKMTSGDRLVVTKLAGQLGVSATPVREALVELHNIGLVDLLPNRGGVCLPFGVRQLREIYHIRRILEVETIRLACGHIPKKQLVSLTQAFEALAMQDCMDPDWSPRAIDYDIALHTLIAEHCGNSRICHELDRYAVMMRAIREVAGNQRDIQKQAIDDHLQIISALMDGDASAASRAMSRHIDHTAVNVEPLIFKGDKPG